MDQPQVGHGGGWRNALKVPFDWIDSGLDWFERSALIACVAGMATVTVSNVIARNLLGFSLQFANDTAQMLLVMVTFLGIGIGARHARHIRVSALHDLLPHLGQKILLVFVNLTTAWLLLALADFGWNYATSVQRTCRVLPDAMGLGFFSVPIGGMPLTVGIVVTLIVFALGGHLIRLATEGGERLLARFEGLRHHAVALLGLTVLALLAWGVFHVFIEMVNARSGQCRVTSSTGFPVYLNYMVVPLGFLFGGIQFFLAGVRNLISPENYLSWYQKDEYEEEGADPGMTGGFDPEEDLTEDRDRG
ncbi:TRAP transporter small permease subunit [Salicola sp. Rm-C-2C1-2]|uniref:TRAP transporter small permease n=1 Tax=Salicola sp. Rm-C-2C1-2 TaxID=3141321 RepID=UPI0032E426DA